MRTVLAAVVTSLVVGSLVVAQPVSAQTGDAAQELADRYAPIVMVSEQSEECDPDGERFEPASVEVVLDNPEVFLRQVGNDDPVAMRAPGSSDIFDLQEGWYLDFPGDALEPGCIFEKDYRRFSAQYPSTVYAHIATEAGRPGMLGLQYWFFWYHNPGKNDHEGDWEFMQILFDVGTVEEALTTDPIAIGAAQHVGGQRLDWDDESITVEGDRPVVYPSRGSHATYLEPGVYLGRSDEFFGCDHADPPSRRVDPSIVVLPHEVTDPDDEFAWLMFDGRWGQRERGFFNGPTGPAEKPRWDEPVTWHEELRQSSVMIPSGDSYDGVVGTFCSVVEQGSLILVQTFRSPISVLVALALLGLVVQTFVRRTTWSPVTIVPLRARRAAGQILRSTFRASAKRPLTLVLIGLVAIPISMMTSLVTALVLNLPFVGEVVDVAGEESETGVAIALLVSGLGGALMYALIAGLVAATIEDRHERWDDSKAFVVPLVLAFARASVVVIGLGLTVVGIPWAIRQLVRYQVLPQVIVYEGLDGADALRRCGDVVRGRWFWTAAIFSVAQFVIGLLGMSFALLVLILFQGMPLWLFSLFSSLVFELLLPIFGVLMAYVYGSHIARHAEEVESAEPEPEVAPVS